MPIPHDPHKALAKAVGRIPSGVFVLTAGRGENVHAMLASWVQQCSFAPPAVSVAVAKDRNIIDAIRQGKGFCLSILGQHDHALMRKYARASAAGAGAFDGVRTILAASGTPVLAEAVAYLDCRLLSTCDFGADHEVFVAEVLEGKILKDAASFTHLRGSGMHY